MKLNVKPRPAEKKSDSKSLRREGFVPACMYVQGKPSETIAISKGELEAFLRGVKPGMLATTRVTLVLENGKEHTALVKDIQYDVTSYSVLHVDFEELKENVLVNVNVPIECTGVADCMGIKLGGVLRQVIRSLRVQCLPKDLPETFKLNISSLGLYESKRLNEIEIPKNVVPKADLKEVAVVIAKR